VVAVLESGPGLSGPGDPVVRSVASPGQAGSLLIASSRRESLLADSPDPELTPVELERLFTTLA
jgi:hypothetical protein